MRVFVNRKEETSFFIEHQNKSIFDPDLVDVEEFVIGVQKALSKPQCCSFCEECCENYYENGGCPCPEVMSSL